MACLTVNKSNLILLKGIEMPKLKTKSSAKKRFSVTGTGKLKRNFAKKRHCLFCKSQKMKRQARGTTLVSEVDVQIVKKFLPYL
jgi:large subunit ribosomal protein L35